MVSRGGGIQPRWRRDGKELFFVSPDFKLMAVDVSLMPTFRASIPKPLFSVPMRGAATDVGLARYDVTPDGQRFLVDAVGPGANSAARTSPITVVLNWQAGLKK
jgi:hypothetical protein